MTYLAKINKAKLYNNIPYIVLTISLVIVHYFIFPWDNDGIHFFNATQAYGLLEFLKMRYSTWSSRVIIEGVLYIIVQWDGWIWKILNIFFIVLCAKMISYLFNSQNSKQLNWIICALVIMFPAELYKTAGWGATTMNYLWVLSMGLVSLIPIKKYIKREKLYSWEYLLLSLALIYASNQEQMAIILFSIYSFMICYMIKYKTINKFIIVQWFIIFANIIFIISCPGNKVRLNQEINSYMPNFGEFSILQKSYNGIMSTILYYLTNYEFIFFIFALTITIAIWIKTTNYFKRIISVIPFVITLYFSFIQYFLKLLNGFQDFKEKVSNNIYLIEEKVNQSSLLDFIFCIGLILLIIYLLYIISSNKGRYILLLGILALGFGSRVMLGFSPTLYASSFRTTIFMSYSFIIAIIIILNYIQLDKKVKIIYNSIILIFALTGYGRFLLFVLR